MKVYLVGGAIRDKFLFLPIKEKDWVVVDSSLEEMIKLGFKKVGKSFPVFIHPISYEEYALARTENKTGFKHNEFKCYFNKITIEEDLYRRDITINSIAEDNNGKIIDPYNGIYDIENRIIRHTSDSFKDDPLRVLRVARFYSYLYIFKFKIFFNTLKIMKNIVKNNELKYLSSERIWQETKKSILTNYPEYFFYILNKCGALYYVFPEFFYLLDIKSKKISNFNILIKLFKKIKLLNKNEILRFISLLYILILYKINKYIILNDKEYIKKFIIDKNNIIELLLNRLNFSKHIKKIVIKLISNIYLIERIEFLNENDIVKLFYNLNIYKNINNLFFILQITFIYRDDKILFIDNNNNLYNKKQYIYIIWKIINSININKIIKKINKKYIKKIIYINQVKKLKKWILKNNFRKII